jgi:hypothetical protein
LWFQLLKPELNIIGRELMVFAADECPFAVLALPLDERPMHRVGVEIAFLPTRQ